MSLITVGIYGVGLLVALGYLHLWGGSKESQSVLLDAVLFLIVLGVFIAGTLALFLDLFGIAPFDGPFYSVTNLLAVVLGIGLLVAIFKAWDRSHIAEEPRSRMDLE